ncbi:MAG: reverse gyrase [Caldisphaeraceae archaeon]|nr:reverse gyrase [Caldisphaeraceae archaeon]
MPLNPIFRHLCPNCGMEIEASRLYRGLPCRSCLEEEIEDADPVTIGEILKKKGKLKGYRWLYVLEKSYRDFSAFFTEKTGFTLSSAQKSWAKRLLYPESFSIVAPTGVGKTTLLMVYAAYKVLKNGGEEKVIYLTPTENLIYQTSQRLSEYLGDAIAYYYSSMPKDKKNEMINRIEGGKFSVLVITPGYLMRRFETLKKYIPFGLIIVDDVDSLLRNSKNIDRVLVLLGFSQESVDIAYRLVSKKIDYAITLANKRFDRSKVIGEEIANLQIKLLTSQANPVQGQLVIASATGRPRGIKHLVFRELLGFEIGGGTDYLRNVIDTYIISKDVVGEAIEVVKKLGSGGLVYVSQSYGKPLARILVERLKENGINAQLAITNSRKAVDKLESGKVEVLVGLASRYGTIVRGIDLPEIIKYAVFIGTPARKLELQSALLSPQRLLRVVTYLEARDKGYTQLKKSLENLSSKYSAQSPIVVAALKGSIEAKGSLKALKDLIESSIKKVYDSIMDIIPSDGETVKIGTIIIRNEGGKLYLYSPDAPTYLQASGRTSRLYYGHMTKGISVIIDSIPELIESIKERLKWMSLATFSDFREVDIGSAMKEVMESRKADGGKKVNIVSELIVVESPTKARTIANFWGRPARRREGNLNIYETTTSDPLTNTVYLLTITASRGHVYELAVDDANSCYGIRATDHTISPIYTSIKRCLKCGLQFTNDVDRCPKCGSSAIITSDSVLETIKKLATEVDQIILMTDPDREGEKISWDLYLALKPYNKNISRSSFHEVTLRAVMEALRVRGDINRNLVDAQISRRIDDRWVGFTTSQYLQFKYNKLWLGAGRVQTPVLGWVIERYNLYKNGLGYKVRVRLPGGTYIYYFTKDKEEAEKASKEGVLYVTTLNLWKEEVNPLPPYTTDAMIYDAGQKLGYSAEVTMKLAQDLFYSGLITYHRTDSTRVSQAGIQVAKSYLEATSMAEHFKPRTWGNEGAHEAIRPTRPLPADALRNAMLERSIVVPIEMTYFHYRLYQMIFERFIASQMDSSVFEKAEVRLRIGSLEQDQSFIVGILKDGFSLITRPKVEEWVVKELNKEYEVKPEDVLYYKGSSIELYKNGDLVMLMKKKNIGRPSTYAKIIDSNKRHGYIIETKKRKYVIPTKTGIEIYRDLMSSEFRELLTEESSRLLEEQLDLIENGRLSPIEFINKVYNDIFVTRLKGRIGSCAV